MLNEIYQRIAISVLQECQHFYGSRLVSFCLFGSVARGTMNETSDIDFLIIAENLPNGRVKRVREFMNVEKAVGSLLHEAQKSRVFAELSPVLKTPAEVEIGSPLFLDMLEDGKILYDREMFLKMQFEGLQARLKKLGAKRVWWGEAWYWVLKADYQIGEVFEI